MPLLLTNVRWSDDGSERGSPSPRLFFEAGVFALLLGSGVDNESGRVDSDMLCVCGIFLAHYLGLLGLRYKR